jgi:hypothetical protein
MTWEVLYQHLIPFYDSEDYDALLKEEAKSGFLHEQLPKMPVKFSTLPYYEYIHDNTPVQSIRSSTEQLLWHQHLGHPSNYYLYNAHKHIDGVPKFKHMDHVLEVCPTCIHSKQTKEPAGPQYHSSGHTALSRTLY